MGEFLSLAAASGIQIIIETHSDHLMNGIRIACRKEIIGCNQVEMDLIGLDADGYTHTRRPVQLNPDGTVKNLVPGFFDEWERHSPVDFLKHSCMNIYLNDLSLQSKKSIMENIPS